MARESAKEKAGFFPTPTAAIDMLLPRLKCEGQVAHILDPCAGAGAALNQLGTGLYVPPERSWAIELDGYRGDEIRSAIPGANVLAPCSAFGARISMNAFGLIYLNPPFDNVPGTRSRYETIFLRHCTKMLRPKGILVLACPEYILMEEALRKTLLSWYHDGRVYAWPGNHRKYGEVYLIAVKNDQKKEPDLGNWKEISQPGHVADRRVWTIPDSAGASKSFEKVLLTDDEVLPLLDNSPANELLRPPPLIEELPSPPLALGAGHRALLLATGALDGVVHPDGEPPHVIRGTARKVEEIASEDTDGDKTTTRIRERFDLVINVLTSDGQLHTLT